MKNLEVFKYMIVAAIALVAVITSIEDIRERKIRNKWLLAGIAFAAAAHLSFVIFVKFFMKDSYVVVNFSYYGKFFVNVICAFAVAVLLWKTDIWSAGDSKLFIAFSFMYPLDYYNKGFMDFFPASAMLINIFFVSFTVMVLHTISAAVTLTLSRTLKLEMRAGTAASLIGKGIKEKWAVFIVIFLAVNLLFFFVNILRDSVGNASFSMVASIAFFAVMFFFMSSLTIKLRALFEKKAMVRYGAVAGMLAASALVVLLYPAGLQMLLKNMKRLFIYGFTIGLIFGLLTVLIDKTESVKTQGAGMGEQNETPGSEQEPIENRHLPFAPLAAAGVLLTLVLKCSIVHYIFSGG